MKRTKQILVMLLCAALTAVVYPMAAYAADYDLEALIIADSGCTHHLRYLIGQVESDHADCHTFVISSYDGSEVHATSGDGWSYDVASNTLTLDGYKGAGFYAEEAYDVVNPLTVKLVGDNVITGIQYGSEPSLHYTAVDVSSDMNIQGPGTLTVNAYQGINTSTGQQKGLLHVSDNAVINTNTYRVGLRAGEMIIDSGCVVIANTTKPDDMVESVSSNPVVTQHTRCNGTLITTNANPNENGIASAPYLTAGPSVTLSVGTSAADATAQTIPSMPSEEYGADTGRFYIYDPLPYMALIEAGYNGSGAVTAPTATPDTPKTTTPDTPTDDIPSSWAVEQVTAATELGLVPTELQSSYTQATTRAEFCALAVALYETATGTEITERSAFADTTDINVEKAAAIGVVSGVGDNMFSPDTQLTREQAAAMLSRLAEAAGKPLAASAATFADNDSISDWATAQVGQIQAAGIMGGVGANTFAPQDPYTREQSIITIMRLYDYVENTGASTVTSPPTQEQDVVNIPGNTFSVEDGILYATVDPDALESATEAFVIGFVEKGDAADASDASFIMTARFATYEEITEDSNKIDIADVTCMVQLANYFEDGDTLQLATYVTDDLDGTIAAKGDVWYSDDIAFTETAALTISSAAISDNTLTVTMGASQLQAETDYAIRATSSSIEGLEVRLPAVANVNANTLTYTKSEYDPVDFFDGINYVQAGTGSVSENGGNISITATALQDKVPVTGGGN